MTKAANKVRAKTLRAINSRMKKKVGESDLARVKSRLEPGETFCRYQAAMYAKALGVTPEDARERIARHENTLRAAGQPGPGTSPAQAAAWLASVAPNCGA